MGTPVPSPSNSPVPGKPKSATMGAIPTTQTSPRAIWTLNIAPLNQPTLPPQPQSPPRARGKERPKGKTRPPRLKSQRPVPQLLSPKGLRHCQQRIAVFSPPAYSPLNMRTRSAWLQPPQTLWLKSSGTPTAPTLTHSPPLSTPKEPPPCPALTSTILPPPP